MGVGVNLWGAIGLWCVGDAMTPEEIEYVREWAASGNEPRASKIEGSDRYTVLLLNHEMEILGGAGLTIARLADALEQACEVAEGQERVLFYERGAPQGVELSDLETMRKNRKELLG